MTAPRSNKDLASEASDLGKKLGIEVTTDGLKNQELVALVDELREQQLDAKPDLVKRSDPLVKADEKPAADPPKAVKAVVHKPVRRVDAPETVDGASPPNEIDGKPPKPEPVESAHPYAVAAGRYIMTDLGGPVRAGEEIKPGMLSGGRAKLDELVEKGAVIKKG